MRLFLLASIAFAQAPFPDPAALLKESQANQQKMAAIRENYTFHRIVTEEDLDDNSGSDTDSEDLFWESIGGRHSDWRANKEANKIKALEDKLFKRGE